MRTYVIRAKRVEVFRYEYVNAAFPQRAKIVTDADNATKFDTYQAAELTQKELQFDPSLSIEALAVVRLA